MRWSVSDVRCRGDRAAGDPASGKARDALSAAPDATAAAPWTLIETKLVPPRPQAGTIERRRLHARLDGYADRALILIDAPVGFGKTVLAQSWCGSRSDAATAWVSLDAADEDPVRLWTHVATSLDRIDRSLGARALARLRAPEAPVAEAVDELANGLAVYGRQIDLVLDDMHSVEEPASLQPLEQLVDRLPSNARLVVVTRADPPIRLGRLRASRLLGEVRQQDLAFTTDEARALLVGQEGIALAESDIERLMERTEGWPAGLYLAGLWLRDVADPSRAVRDFSGDHRHVADYLGSEVLDLLDEPHRRFLTRTAVLGRFCASLCDATLDRDDSAAMLADIVRSNVFVVGLDGRGEWYRYHHLFRELLALELHRLEPTAVDALHRRASGWFRAHGFTEEAIEHAAAAGETGDVVELLREQHLRMIRSGHVRTLVRWVDALPDAVLQDAPDLAGAAALACGMLSRPAAERHRFVALAERTRSQRPAAWSPYAAAVVAIARAVWPEDDVGKAIAAAREALELAPTAGDAITAPAYGSLACAQILAGDIDAAEDAATRAVAHPTSPHRPVATMAALAVLALVEIERGRPLTAQPHAERALALARADGLADTSNAAIVFMALAAVRAAEGRWADAERDAERAELLHRTPDRTVTHAHALLVLADIRLRRGRLARAQADVDHARQEIDGFPDAGRLGTIVERLQMALDEARTRAGPPVLVEPPTEAELLVLRLLATPLSQREIGAHLFLSMNTVKTHSRELYRKLGVRSRDEAVARALELSLIDDDASPG
jgi:LuxR family maltose regulon positive regulatory protein